MAGTLRGSESNLPNYNFFDQGFENLVLRPHPAVANPVLEASDITDNCASGVPDFVADPFLFYENGTFYMFFEVHCSVTPASNNYISYATSPDGLTWAQSGTAIIANPGNAGYTYPYMWKYNNTYYIMPSVTNNQNKLEIWSATSITGTWTMAETFCSSGCDTTFTSASPDSYGDPVMFRFQNRWWLVYYNYDNESEHSTYAWYTDDDSFLDATWIAHTNTSCGADCTTAGQIIDNAPTASRPGGRPIVKDDYIIFFYQDGLAHYADKVRAYKWTALTPSTFTQTELTQTPLLVEDDYDTWRSEGMHQLDILQTSLGGALAVVDGHNSADGSGGYSIGIFEVGPEKYNNNFDIWANVINLGADAAFTGVRTLDTSKKAYITMPSRSNISGGGTEPNLLLLGVMQAGAASILRLGGGDSNFDSATSIGLYTVPAITDSGSATAQLTVDVSKSQWSFLDAATSQVSPARTTKEWFFTFSAVDDGAGDDCTPGISGTGDCFTLPDPTTHGRAECFVHGIDEADCGFIYDEAGNVTLTSPNVKCAFDTFTGDTLTIDKSVGRVKVVNELGQTETITCHVIYD